MDKGFFAFVALFAFVGSARADVVNHVIEGDVKETCVAAVKLNPCLYAEATQGRENALASELRMYEDGSAVPYVIRQELIRKKVEKCRSHTLRLAKAVEQNGLTIEVELPKSEKTSSRFCMLEIETPLTDFEQMVTVKVGDEVKATCGIYDYSRFAAYRRTRVPVQLPSSGVVTISFARPLTDAEAAEFERTISETADGVSAKLVRRVVQQRPFKITALRVIETWDEFSFEPAPAWDVDSRAEAVRHGDTKTTTVDFETHGMPLTAVGIRTKDENFSRYARVFARRDQGWTRLTDGRLKVVNLRGKKERILSLSLGREVREPVLRIELDDGDNPPISFEELPVSVKVVPYDVAFIAKPEKKYELRIEHGADLPRYDQVVRESIAEVKDPVRLDFKAVAELGGDAPTETWLTWNPILCISITVFVLLAVVCFWLFKSTNNK